MKKYTIIIVGFMLVGMGCALTLKADAGIGAWDALAKSISDMIGMEIGTAGILLNCLCVLGQLLILKRKFRLEQLLQIPLSMLLGIIINFMAYDLFTFQVDSLPKGVLLYLLASTICAIGVSMVMLVNKVTFALEGFCMAITSILAISFHRMRQLMDICSIVTVLLLSYVFSLSMPLGIGTVLGILMFGPSIGIIMKILRPIFHEYEITDRLVERQYQELKQQEV